MGESGNVPQGAARRAAGSTVTSLFAARAAGQPRAPAIREGDRVRTYGEVLERVRRLAAALESVGVGPGDRVAIVSENRAEFLETFLAAGWLGAIAACPSWRLADPELDHCLRLVAPTLVLTSERHEAKVRGVWSGPRWVFGDAQGECLSGAAPAEPRPVDPEAPLLILYTSGTTGLPKGAVISHRAEIARNLVTRAECGLQPQDAFVAWAPMFHLGGAEYSPAR